MRTSDAALGYRPELDGLRAVAVGLVVAHHAGCPALLGGNVGVDVFFALSGFLITSLLLAERRDTGRVRYGRFLARRALRLVPALWLLLAAYVFVGPALGWGGRGFLVGQAALAAGYVSNWTLAAGLDRPARLEHTWSLAVEEQFYLIWPPLLVLFARVARTPGRLAAVLFGLAAAVAVWRCWLVFGGAASVRVYNGLDTRADALLVGAGMAALHAAGVRRWWSTGGGAAAVSAGLLVLFAAESRAYAPWMMVLGFPAVAWLSGLLVLACVHRPGGRLAGVLGWGPLVGVGRVSYGVYLWHYPLVRALQEQSLPWPAVLAFGAGGAVLAAAGSYRWVERPCLRLKRYFEPDRGPQPPPGRPAGEELVGRRRVAVGGGN